MIDAIAGDIIASSHEANPIKTIDFPLFAEYSRFREASYPVTFLAF